MDGKNPSYTCMKMKISKRGTEKESKKKKEKGKKHLFPNIMNSPTLFINKKNIMSLCENEKNQKGGQTK
jgi:glutaredoxin